MLELVVFCCGAAVMILEIVGARVLAPFLGTSIVVWSGLIGVVLASLAVGYWQGGRLADRRPSARVLSVIILLAAVLTAATAATKIPLLDYLVTRAAGLRLAVVAATLLLFAPAAGLLGMVAPFAVRLKLRDPATVGTTAGRLYALSTVGSIVGTFAAGFFLIAALGTTTLLLVVAAFLVAVSFAASRTEVKAKAAVVAVIALASLGLYAQNVVLVAAGVVDVDTTYGRVLIYQGLEPKTGRPIRVMTTGPTHFQSAIYPDAPDVLALDYARFFDLGFAMVPQARRVLVLGGGGYTFPRHALATHPQTSVTVVELDPGVTALATAYFALRPHPDLAIVHEDARVFLNRDEATYDLIYVDAFSTDYAPPFHLVTREAAEKMAARLAPDGAIIVNVIAPAAGMQARLPRALAATFASVFEEVSLYPLGKKGEETTPQNVMLVARKQATPFTPPQDAETRRLLGSKMDTPVGSDALVLTDDYAPVEWLCALPLIGG
jgi:spermidine synthase